MKQVIFTLITTALLFASFSSAKAQKLKTQLDSIAYAMGISLGEATSKDGIKLNHKILYKSYKASMEGEELITEEGTRKIMQSLQKELRAREGEAFTDKDKPKTNLDTVAMALGVNIASNLQRSRMALSGKLITKGYRDGINTKENKLDSAAIQQLMLEMQALQQEGMAEQQRIDAEKSKREAEAFLAENKQKDGVVELESGLQYKVLQEGSGESPTAKDKVVVHYKGYLINGDVFDSSYDRGQPAEFPLNAVIAGWTEGLQYMKPGAKFTFYIPSDLAYGDRGQGKMIKPGAMLMFDVELLEVKKK